MERALAAWLLLAAGPAAAPGPTEVVQQAVVRLAETLEEGAPAGTPAAERRRAEIRRIADRVFDFPEMARRVLGRHWAERTASERQEFVALFRDLMERGWLARLEEWSGERIAWGPETLDGDSATVRSRVLAGRRGEVALAFRLHLAGGRWAVYDVLVEGVSLVSSYRSQFNRVIQTGSYADLTRRLRARQGLEAVAERTSR
jgi:phospholipid transport system substrate-binding protein